MLAELKRKGKGVWDDNIKLKPKQVTTLTPRRRVLRETVMGKEFEKVNVNKKVQLDATMCRHLFTAKSLYMFRASQHPSSGALKTVTATSGIGHNTGTATSFQRGLLLSRPRWKEVAVPVL